MPSLMPQFTLRFPDDLMNKLRTIAEKNKRSVNRELEFIVEKYVAEYEKENGLVNG